MQRWEKNRKIYNSPSPQEPTATTSFKSASQIIFSDTSEIDFNAYNLNSSEHRISSEASTDDKSVFSMSLSDGSADNISNRDSDDDVNAEQYDSNDGHSCSDNGTNDARDDADLEIRPLYANSSLSVDESVLNLLDLYIKNKWTKASLLGTLEMLRKMLPEENEMPESLFKLFQYVKNCAPPVSVIKHLYCRNCSKYNGIMDSRTQNCSSCNADKKYISFFFEIDVYEQIKFLFEKRNLAEKLKDHTQLYRDSHVIADITDGSEYLRVNLRHNRQKYDLTLILNTDGLSLVKSSKSHCWPLMFTICELPEHLRESFLVVIGLWYDDNCKPLMNTFLEPFQLKFKKCFEDGISWIHPKSGDTIISKIVAPLIVADAPARAQIQNIVNFNGRYGCNICEIKMKPAKSIEGKKNCRVYIYNNNISKLRTGNRMKRQAQKVLDSEKDHVKGVKGNSIISNLPLLDLGTCVLPEYMHCTLLGVGRQIITLWMEKKGPWSLKKRKQDIDKLLFSIRPPHFFNRMPRSITLTHFYKASEYYNFILFYSLPVLENYLPYNYLQHWMLFVRALFLLLQERITKPDLAEADTLLHCFVKQIKTLYTDRQLSYNVHQLLHLVLAVERWGPLWATSAFPFENFNGFLANNVHGKKHLGQEMINNLTIAQGVQVLRSRVAEQNMTVLLKRKTTQSIGKCVHHKFNDFETELFRSNDVHDLENLSIYARAQINNEIFTSLIYKTTKTNSYTVQIQHLDITGVLYGAIRFFFHGKDQLLSFVLDSYTVEHTKIFDNPEMQAK